jgi:hypothetical protein
MTFHAHTTAPRYRHMASLGHYTNQEQWENAIPVAKIFDISLFMYFQHACIILSDKAYEKDMFKFTVHRVSISSFYV